MGTMVREPLTDSEAKWGKFNKYEMSIIRIIVLATGMIVACSRQKMVGCLVFAGTDGSIEISD
jgi:hypothetical protein